MCVYIKEENLMPKKIVVVNAGPRKGWNTDQLLTAAAQGAESVGALKRWQNVSGLIEEERI